MSSLNIKIKKQVAERADYVCEYCCSLATFAVQPFVIEHIVPISKGGTDELENLAFSCGGCNGSKYNRIHHHDPIANVNTALYNPRVMRWSDHYIWSDDFLEMVGISSTGRATILALQTNRQGVKNLRKLLLTIQQHPPKDFQ